MAGPVKSDDLTIGRIASAALVALWLALLAAYAGAFGWFLDLFAHFRVQYAALFVVCAAMLLAANRRVLALTACVGALLSAWPLAGYVAVPAGIAEAGPERFRV